MLDNVPKFLKDNWYYVLGAVIGLWLIMRSRGGGGDSMAGFYAAAAQGNAAQMQANTANAAMQAQVGLQQAQLNAEVEKSKRDDALARDTLNAQAQVGFLSAQAQMADSVGKSASGVIGALYQPTVAAINASAYENAATAQSAAVIAASGFQSQAGMVNSASSAIQSVGRAVQGWGGVAQGVAGIKANAGPTTSQQLLGIGGNLGMSYLNPVGGFTGGGRAW